MTDIWSKAPEWATELVEHKSVRGRFAWVGDCKAALTDDLVLFTLMPECWTTVYTRPAPSWSGEGLPPVGTVCEVDWCEEWHRCEIIAHFQQSCGMVAAFTVDIGHGNKSLDAFGADCFQPIRTPEQIAADERDKAIKAIVGLIESADSRDMTIAEAIYNAGYRKPC